VNSATSQTRSDLLHLFGQLLADRRHRTGASQESLAQIAGLHRTYVGSVERGERNPTLTTIARLAAALDCSPSELLAGLDLEAVG
jgi:transcriptional regulator with XRE-family HTH domain